MRATDGLQTTITLSSVKDDGQSFSLELSLEMSLPMPRQDEHLPDQAEAFVHQAGLEVQGRLFQVLIEVVAQRETRAVLDKAFEAQLTLLGPAAADPNAVTGFLDDDLPFDDSEEAETEWEQVQAEWIATGFPGCEPACPVAKDKPRAVDEAFVIVEPDEVKTKAQPSTGRKEV